MSDIIGYFKKVSEKNGHITAMFSYSKKFDNGLYLYLEKESEVGYSELKKRLAIYQNYINFQSRVVITVDDTNTKTSTGINKVVVKSVKEYAEVRREKAVEILKENFESQKKSTLEALYLSGLERIAVIEAAEKAEKNWLLNISGHAGEEAYFDKKELDGSTNYYFFIMGNNKKVFHSDSREKLYKEVIEYGEARRQGTAKQSLLCKKYKEENDE